MLDRILTVRVDRITRQTDEVTAFEFVHPAGRALPGYQAGAHIDVYLPGGFMRPYSLARAPAEGTVTRYVIGVKREPASRGGSAALHERVRLGDLLAIGTPRNTFALRTEAAHVWLLAGGIGLTPLLAMAQQRARAGRPYTLAVFARSRAHLAFADELAALGESVRRHYDDPAAPEKIELAALLSRPRPGHEVYLCGPAGFMRAALDAAALAGWPDGQLHLEYFAPPDAAAAAGSDAPFVLELAGRGIEVTVAADQGAVDALHDLGIDVPTSCEQGLCGSCVVGWRVPADRRDAGAPEHRDHCLSVAERQHKVALCCSRAQAGRLVIEL
jgi:vanillate O-demethylase ferredoxin subunit